jgi:hypothetical protein
LPENPEKPLLQNQTRQFKPTAPVSSELFVAMMIYHLTMVCKEKVWYTKLVASLNEYMPKQRVSEAIDTLTDWLIITGEYGETENRRAGWLISITIHDCNKIKQLYDQYWIHIVSGTVNKPPVPITRHRDRFELLEV